MPLRISIAMASLARRLCRPSRSSTGWRPRTTQSAFPADSEISERVLFPMGPTESHGMEDARFVRFTHDNGKVVYLRHLHRVRRDPDPPPAHRNDGLRLLSNRHPQRSAPSRTRALPFSLARSMAASPRLSRQDNENNYLMLSDNVRFWHETEKIQEPRAPLGTRPARQLWVAAGDRSRLVGDHPWRGRDAAVHPRERSSSTSRTRVGSSATSRSRCWNQIGDERDGYVPNVVYSCGSMIHGNHLVLPYGFSDVGARIATVPLDDLLTRLTGS